ncbi:tRNA dihydrouridine synthase DusB [Terrisporobacter sp.]|uniref:tRNA dihydrouridine synthase DusB n=1 Tax=Terrisporobacter sp. TaxID=1965305 RepID=UPI00261A5A9A|nr:tRNA dihydrouridine synthase DusB [Terrisporobacter sp.]
MKIGNVQLDNEVFLSPMAGVTDLPFRTICKEKGCGMLYTEMINAKALSYNDENTKKMLNMPDDGHPVAIQIFGSDPEFMGKAASILNEYPNKILDINMGCPAPKVVKNGDGSALMRNPELAAKVLSAVVENSDKPVTLKIRKGWDDTCVNAVEIAKIAEECGISAVAIHGRTREQFYSGKADWDIIRDIKGAINIPVIGNGDVFDVQDAVNMLEKTKCDAIMIGRGSQGNPWIFKRINHYMKTGEILPEPTLEEKMNTAIRHMNLAVEEHGEYVAVREMRKHIGWYLKGLKNSARYRDQINKITDYKEVIAMLEEYVQHSLTQLG